MTDSPDAGSTPLVNTAEPVSVQTLDPKIIKAIKDGKLDAISDWIANKHGTVDSYTDAPSDGYRVGICVISTKGMTALCYAALHGEMDIINELLSAGANPAVANVDGENALHCAVQSDKGDTAISEVVLRLLENRSDIIDVVTASQWTALLMAISLNLPTTVKTLLERGANPAIDFKERRDLRDCLNLAIFNGSEEMVKMLLETGKCDVNITATKRKYTPLHVAVRSPKPESVKRFVSHGADTKARDSLGKCPIHYALRVANVEVFKSLITALQDSINERDRSGHTILHTAVKQGKIGHVRVLRLNFNAACTLKDGKGKLPIHYVYEQRSLEDFQELVDLLGESVNKKDSEGYTLLHIAIGRNSPEFIEVLLDIKADPTIKTKAGQSLIHIATNKQLTDEDFSTLLKLFQKKVKNFNIDEEDKEGRTALHWALSRRKFSKVKILLQNKADPAKFAHCDGKNSLHYAFEKHSTGDIIKELLAK